METAELFLLIVIVFCLLEDKASCKDWWSNWKAAWKEYFSSKRGVNDKRATETSEE